MALEVYNYLGERKIAISVPDGLRTPIARNIEESAESALPESLIEVSLLDEREIRKDKTSPFLSTRKVEGFPERYEYYRYNTHVRTVERVTNGHFKIDLFRSGNLDAVYDCMQKDYYSSEHSNGKALVHASVVRIGGSGILIPGKCHSGKTALTTALLERYGGIFVSEGMALISQKNGELWGHYLPRPVCARFCTLANSPRLKHLLDDISLCEVEPTVDLDAVYKIIESRAFDVDAGVSLSRKQFIELLGLGSASSTRIDRVIFPRYAYGREVSHNSIDNKQAFGRLRDNEFPIDVNLGIVGHQADIISSEKTVMNFGWIADVRASELGYSNPKDLTFGLMEDIIA